MRAYSGDGIDAIASGAERLGFAAGQGALEGAPGVALTVPEALPAVIRGVSSPEDAAARLRAEAERRQGEQP